MLLYYHYPLPSVLAVMVIVGTGVRVAVPALHIDLQYIYPIEIMQLFPITNCMLIIAQGPSEITWLWCVVTIRLSSTLVMSAGILATPLFQ